MQLSEQTLEVLNNFKTIQPNIVFREGSVLKTMADAKNVMASADIDIGIPSEFGIYDLSEFLATLNLVDSPVLDLKKDHALVRSTSGRSRIKYYFSDPDMLTSPAKDIKMPSTEVSFMLDVDTLSKLKKAAATLGHEMLTITPSDGALELSVCDIENSTSNAFSIDVAGQFEGDFRFVMNMNNLKLMMTDYDVTISKKLISNFISRDPNTPVQYWVALEKSSSYQE